MRTVWITEKPSTARVLARHVRGDVVSAEGHLLEPKEPDAIDARWAGNWALDQLPIEVGELPLQVGQDRSGKSLRPKLDRIAAALRDADEAVIACDSGREGSLIGWEILAWLRWRGPVRRLLLEATDERSVEAALERMRADPKSGERDYAAYKEARARQHEDWHMGMNGTRLACLVLRPEGVRGVWSHGGVQTPTLALLARRELEIRNFVSRRYFKVAMEVAAGPHRLTLLHDPRERIFEQAAAEAIAAAARNWQGALRVECKAARRAPRRLFNLQTLQRRAAKMFGWRPDRTEKIAQELYDGGYATYPRTETDFLKDAEIPNAPRVLDAIAGSWPDLAPLVPAEPVIRKGLTYKAADAEHFAYVPTGKPLGRDVSDEARRLHRLIAMTFLAHHLPDAIDEQTRVTALVPAAGGERAFTASGTVERQPGWRLAFRGAEDDRAAAEEDRPVGRRDEDEEEAGRLPPVTDGTPARAAACAVRPADTKPPPRITVGELPELMARLIDFVEEPAHKAALHNPVNPDSPKGLGTAASRKEVITKLLKRGYVAELGGRHKDPPLEVTGTGMAFITAMQAACPQESHPVSRAVFEHELRTIGEAGSRADADRREAAFRDRTFQKIRAMKEAIRQVGPVTVAPAASGATERVYLDVPFDDNAKVSRLGGQFDREKRAWYVPVGDDPKPFARWLPKAGQPRGRPRAGGEARRATRGRR